MKKNQPGSQKAKNKLRSKMQVNVLGASERGIDNLRSVFDLDQVDNDFDLFVTKDPDRFIKRLTKSEAHDVGQEEDENDKEESGDGDDNGSDDNGSDDNGSDDNGSDDNESNHNESNHNESDDSSEYEFTW